jgi:cytochrome c553
VIKESQLRTVKYEGDADADALRRDEYWLGRGKCEHPRSNNQHPSDLFAIQRSSKSEKVSVQSEKVGENSENALVGRVTPGGANPLIILTCAPWSDESRGGAHGVTLPTNPVFSHDRLASTLAVAQQLFIRLMPLVHIRVSSGAFLVAIASLFAVASDGHAAEPNATELQFFESKIRPILVDNCYKCHSHEATKLKGGLSVEYKESLLKGGSTGAAIVPGDPENSLLIKAVRYTDADLQMPPDDKKLSDQQIADLVAWVKMGAPDPRKAGTTITMTWSQKAKDHWAFQPIKIQTPPAVADVSRVHNGIDNFILAKLDENGMKMSPPADKRTLVRRAYFDLIGLPPSPEEVNAFIADNSPDAFAKVVDKLLASPQYGERWGRFWLDVSRYSDTKGDIKQKFEDRRYPSAWTYRDYVIKSFNADKPFNRFILEQIAADKLKNEDKTDLSAMGFLTLGDRFNNMQHDIINDRIDVVTKGFLGLTVTCARCHDHKFDPIPQQDYYSLHGIFASSIEPPDYPIVGAVPKTPEYQEYLKRRAELTQKIALTKRAFDLNKRMRDRKLLKELREKEGDLTKEREALDATDPGAPPRAMMVVDRVDPKDSRVFIRGEADNKGEVAPRRFLEILSPEGRKPYTIGSGRLELALSIIDPKNPLTARVIVNRVWLHHFGEGIVTTPDDFGNQSAPPSHPELLDFLASAFMETGWSIKTLHRQIMLSSAYQQSSESNARYEVKDPGNRLLWRANIRRLEFESVRDSLLAIGGQLDLTQGGKPVNLGQGAVGYSTRRTVYGYIDRRNLNEIYNQFDFANPDIATGKRYETIVPQQSLFLMNSPLVVEQARLLVHRPEFVSIDNDEARIRMLYQRIYQREPTAQEIKVAERFLEKTPDQEKIPDNVQKMTRREQIQAKRLAAKGKGNKAMSLANVADIKPLGEWEIYAHALLQGNEALFVN